MWNRLAAPGTWWTGRERVAIAAEVRAARDCAACHARRLALSPEAVVGGHGSASAGLLPEVVVDCVHRITTDPGRLSRSWFGRLMASGLEDAAYVEIVGLVAAVVGIDAVCRGLGAALHPLPEARSGRPSRRRPAAARLEGAWVPMIPAHAARGSEADLWGLRTANVLRALSLVPEAVRDLKSLSAAHYLPMEDVPNPYARRSLDRAQMEFVAGRVAALNECFY